MENLDLSHILNHLGEDRESYFNAIAPPVFQSSNFQFADVASMREQLSSEFDYQLYTRGNNPTTDILRKKLAALERTEDALVLSSGSAAIASAVLSQLKMGDHIVCVQNPYTWTSKLLLDIMPRYGVYTTFIDGSNASNFDKATRPETKLYYLESPNSFTFEMQDFKKVVSLAKKNEIVTIADNSYCSPLYQNPADYGVDLVVHSATKYLAGHSDVVAGVICGSRKLIRKIFDDEFMTLGSKLSPWDSWLMIRGLRTLEVRLDRITNSAKVIVDFLADHPKIERVYYPFHESNPQVELAKKQMRGTGGLFTIALGTKDVEKVELFCNTLKRFLLAVSWGGHESLIFPATAGMDKNSQENKKNANLVRIYVGLEKPEVLIRDLKEALDEI